MSTENKSTVTDEEVKEEFKKVREFLGRLLAEGKSTLREDPMWFVIRRYLEEKKVLDAEIESRGVKLDALLAHCGKEGGECSECGKIICPFKDEMHFHHDGCPSCYIAPKSAWEKVAPIVLSRAEAQESKLKNTIALLDEIQKDYDHPWPNEDIATNLHRTRIQSTILVTVLALKKEWK